MYKKYQIPNPLDKDDSKPVEIGALIMKTSTIEDVVEVEVRASAEEFFRDHWPTAFFVPEGDQWHCSNCNAIFKQYSEPAISYCPWCGRKFIHTPSYRAPREKYDAAFLGKTMHFIEPSESPGDKCRLIHKVESCDNCESKDCQIYRNYKNGQDE